MRNFPQKVNIENQADQSKCNITKFIGYDLIACAFILGVFIGICLVMIAAGQ